MKKILLLLILLLIPIFVCAKDEVSIESIEIVDSTNDSIEKTKTSIDGLNANFDLVFTNINDFIKYKIVIDNPTNREYEIVESNLFNKSDYIKYEYSYDDDNRIVEKNSKTTMYIVIKYHNQYPLEQLENDAFHEKNNMVLNLSNKTTNPDTKDTVIIALAMLTISVLIIIIILLLKKNAIYSLLVLLLIPIAVSAIEQLEIKLNIDIAISDTRVFYVYHSSDNTIDTYNYLLNKEGINLVSLVKEDYLYGGFFKDYSLKGSYNNDGVYVDDGEPYTGREEIKPFTFRNLYRGENGTGLNMAPESGKTYYLREIPNEYYSGTRILVVRNINTYEIESIDTVSLTDDALYKDEGLMVDDIINRGFISGSFVIGQEGSDNFEVVNSEITYGIPNGRILNVSLTKYKDKTGTFDMYPYYVTYDGLIVIHKRGIRLEKPNYTSVGLTWTPISRDDYIIREYE